MSENNRLLQQLVQEFCNEKKQVTQMSTKVDRALYSLTLEQNSRNYEAKSTKHTEINEPRRRDLTVSMIESTHKSKAGGSMYLGGSDSPMKPIRPITAKVKSNI